MKKLIKNCNIGSGTKIVPFVNLSGRVHEK